MKNPIKQRLINYEYFKIEELPVGEIPFVVINNALKDEKFFRRFNPTFCRNDLLQGNFSALLYWYPSYVDQMYELAVMGADPMMYFKGLPIEIKDAFVSLFPEILLKLDKAKTLAIDSTELEEIKIKRRKPPIKTLETK